MANAHFVYRVATGHISVATIQGSDTYKLSARSRPSDMPPNLSWSCGLYPRVRDYARRVMTLGGKYATEGFASFTFVISAMTPGMYASWQTDFLSGVESATFTIQIGDKRFLAANEVKVYQCKIHRPDPDSFTFLPGRFVPLAVAVPYEITEATLIT